MAAAIDDDAGYRLNLRRRCFLSAITPARQTWKVCALIRSQARDSRDVRLNDRSMSEAGINAAIAGHFNVPIIAISGDDVVVKENNSLVG